MLPVVSSSSKEYVGSGGKKASLAAILDGHGGQQNRQQSSEKDNPIPLILADSDEVDAYAVTNYTTWAYLINLC